MEGAAPRLVQSGNPLEAGERPLGSGPTSVDGKVTFLVSAFDRASGRRAWDSTSLPKGRSLRVTKNTTWHRQVP